MLTVFLKEILRGSFDPESPKHEMTADVRARLPRESLEPPVRGATNKESEGSSRPASTQTRCFCSLPSDNGSSKHSYSADKLLPSDEQSYRAAGILFWNVGHDDVLDAHGTHTEAAKPNLAFNDMSASTASATLENQPTETKRSILMGIETFREHKEVIFLGGKRVDGENVYMTAARKFNEETDRKLDNHLSHLVKACQESPVFWHAMGKYALFLVDAKKFTASLHLSSHHPLVDGCSLLSDENLPQILPPGFTSSSNIELAWYTWGQRGIKSCSHDNLGKFVYSAFVLNSFQSWLQSVTDSAQVSASFPLSAMQPASATAFDHPTDQLQSTSAPDKRVAVEDRFVPEKELIMSDWSTLVLDGASAAASSVLVTQPLPGEEIYLHSGLYSPSECEKLIAVAEAAGFGFTCYPKDYRGNLRLVTNDPALAEHTWQRLKSTVPASLLHDDATWEAVGLNPHWRLSKYYPGDQFCQHLDTCFTASDSLRSFYTVNVYLNDAFSDGRTRFFDEIVSLRVQPRPGLALVFAQPSFRFYSHDGEMVRDGIKYLIRSDVMYRRVQ